jgi:hypothetical protein
MSMIQQKTFEVILQPSLEITFLIEDFNDKYLTTYDFLERTLNCKNITVRGNLLYDGQTYTTQTMIIPASYIKSNNYATDDSNRQTLTQLKELVKLMCKRNSILCFVQYGTMQRVYDYRAI